MDFVKKKNIGNKSYLKAIKKSSVTSLTAISVLAGEKHILFGMQVQNFCVGIVQYFLP